MRVEIRGNKIRKKLSFFIGIPVFYFFMFVTGTFFLSSCNKSDFSIGEDFVESRTQLKIIDTFKVDLSTVLLDSIVTSQKSIALVGNHKDDVFGTINASSYFKMAYSTFEVLDDKAVFDSANFCLKYSGYSFGDTTSLFTISIHELTEKIELGDRSSFYNINKFNYSSDVIGSKTFYPTPNYGETREDTIVYIHINEFGEKLFDMIKDEDVVVSDKDLFEDYIKGFVLTSENPSNNVILGFTADASSLYFKIYYHLDKEDPEAEKKEISITMGEQGYQFNHVDNDFSGTAIEKLNQFDDVLPSTETGNKAYFQGLIGLMPKVQFPTLGNIFLNPDWKILKAELIIEPVSDSYEAGKNIELPDVLYPYSTNIENELGGILKDLSGDPISAKVSLDNYYNEDTNYTFDITSFIIDGLADGYADPDDGFLIGPESTKIATTVDRLLVDSKKKNIMLKLYYLSY